METMIVLAMHGAPPNDFPKPDLAKYFELHAQMEANHGPAHPVNAAMTDLFSRLDEKMRAWPRNERNDPFYAGSMALARELETQSGSRVLVGFNEYCAPSLEEAFVEAVAAGAERIAVLTPMMTAGGSHAEVDIPVAIQKAQARFPGIEFIYAWPFERSQIASFLAEQLANFLAHRQQLTA